MTRSHLISRSASAAMLGLSALVGALVVAPHGAVAQSAGSPDPTNNRSCAGARLMCTEVADSEAVFGQDNYVGHDEPATIFYSNRKGSGNQMRYQMTVPRDPAGPFSTTKSYNAMLRATFWFGMAMCDTQSFPEQVPNCKPDSDRNIVDPAVSPAHPGTAFMEIQFYPPGFVQQFDGFSCDATRWCAALTIDSLSQDPVAGTAQNPGCQARTLGGIEPVNFAYLTTSGKPQGPPDPLNFDFERSGRPDPAKVLLMNPGDRTQLTIHDTKHGVEVRVDDLTTHRHGSMLASARNGFGQMKFAPAPSTECTVLPYDFHPMYSTSSPATRVTWAAHSYNIAFSDEIGHFDLCTSVNPATASCNGLEGMAGDQEAADGDDNGCFTAAQSTRLPLTGCLDTNTGFDGTSYQTLWPDGNANHPTSVLFSSPRTGGGYNKPYDTAALEADLPRIEAPDLGGPCNRTTGADCTHIPRTDDGVPAAFYPYFSTVHTSKGCRYGIGSTLPRTISDFGRNDQWGPLLPLVYTSGAGTVTRFNDFRNILPKLPC